MLHHSVFTKLLAIMLAMALGLLALVSFSFFYLLGPGIHRSMDLVLRSYTRDLAATRLPFAAAKELSARAHVGIRYEGPAGTWATAENLPTVESVRRGFVPRNFSVFSRRNHYLVPAPDGGTYLFEWTLGPGMGDAHDTLVAWLLASMAGVIVLAYVVLHRLLRPLRTLNDGVAQLGAGNLEVVLPHPTRDEFGRLTEAFNRMVGRVRAMIDARDRLLLDVSHELRSPLTRLKVALEFLPDGPQRAGMASDVAEMERMIAELLELERLRSGRGLQKTRRDLLPILQEVAAQFQNTPPGVQVRSSAAELPVEVDADKIRVVIRNLLENATKYSLPQSRPIEVVAAQEGGAIVVRVTDDGPGIPDSEAERVFEPFFRVDRSRSKNTGGYGLGLSLCKRVMQAHEGDVVLDLARHPGASFVLTLPKAR
ncbi:MAG: HAMP domain-containing histidine kinase [Opitutae bacterium]|nr:HAMP domain-containing histidine kinase [Opitutae bacterium]